MIYQPEWKPMQQSGKTGPRTALMSAWPPVPQPRRCPHPEYCQYLQPNIHNVIKAFQDRFCNGVHVLLLSSSATKYFLPLHSINYVPWTIWLAKSRFHVYLWGMGDQSSSNEITCNNKILFKLIDLILGFSYLN